MMSEYLSGLPGEAHEWVSLMVDPGTVVHVRPIIEHLTGRDPILLTSDDWDNMKEAIADLLEQFMVLRKARQ